MRLFGRTRKGTQRHRCRVCGRTSVKVAGQRHQFTTPKEKIEAVLALLAAGQSLRDVRRATKLSTNTITRIRDAHARPVPVTGVPGRCDWCSRPIPRKDVEYDRPNRRTAHKFCSHPCYAAFYRELRANDVCVRCVVRRRDRLCMIFTRGYCPRCYGILRRYQWDRQRADEHDARQRAINEERDRIGALPLEERLARMTRLRREQERRRLSKKKELEFSLLSLLLGRRLSATSGPTSPECPTPN